MRLRSGDGARILVVEDDGIVALDIQRRLETLGYAVCGAVPSGEEAVARAGEAKPDLVLMDILLKGRMDGIEAAEQIRSRFNVPVVYVSAYADEGTLARAKLTEPYGYVLKPLRERELRTAIEMAVYKHRMERRLAFLFEATVSLFAEPMEYGARLAALARLAVPELGDWCVVDVPEPDGTLRRHAAASPDAARAKWARGLPDRFTVAGQERFGTARALQNGRPEIVPQVPQAPEPRAAAADLLNQIEAKSSLAIPIKVSEKIAGVMVLVSCESGRPYGPDDLALAEDLARRAALSVENAQLFEETKRAVRAREDLLAVVSHDLRSPIGVVRGTSDILLATAPAKKPQVREGLQRIRRCADRMDQLLGSLLDAAKIEAGHLSVEKEACRVTALIDEALEQIHDILQKKHLRVRKHLSDAGARVDCDRIRILQVLSNIAGNAAKFSPEGGTIDVRVDVRDDAVHFRIADSGPGIPEEDRPHVFDRYWQPPGKDRPGYGLGLFIAKGLVEAHGGRIWIEAEPSGTAFSFTLPGVVKN